MGTDRIFRRHAGYAYSLLLIVALLGLTLLGGCASHTPQVPSHELTPSQQTAAAGLWQQYLDICDRRKVDAPFRLSAALRYSTPESGHRIVLRAWGNGKTPVRMDIEAGIGKTLALIRQDAHSFTAYDPRNAKAYVNNNSSNALLRLGLPIPFGINDLGDLLAGRFTSVFPPKYIAVALVPEGGFAYTLAPDAAHGWNNSTLTLNMLGQPQQWSISGKNGRMSITFNRYDAPAESLPGKYTIESGDESSAVLIIKERVRPEKAFTEAQLRLDIPQGTTIRPLPHN